MAQRLEGSDGARMEIALTSPRWPFAVVRRSYAPHTAPALEFIGRSTTLWSPDIPFGRYADQGRIHMTTMIKTLAKRRTLVAIVLALTIFGAVYGFAATLNVGANTLSAGNAAVASCETVGTPTGTYTVAYDSTLAGYKVAGVTVTGLDAGCATKAISVTLTGAANANLGTIAGVVPAGGGSLALTPGSTVSAAGVTGVSVAING
jgi:hypothetical protein